MYMIVVGGGRVGYYLVKALIEEEHEVLLVEKDPEVCETIKEELGAICIRGDGCEAATLAEIGTDRADMLIAVTGDDEDNEKKGNDAFPLAHEDLAQPVGKAQASPLHKVAEPDTKE